MRLGALGVAVAAIVVAAPLRAQVQLQTEISARQIEVGESVQLALSVMSDADGERPASPRLTAPPGVEVRGPGVSSQTHVSIINGRMQKSTGVKLTWTLTPSRAGKFRVGPPSVEIGGKRQQGNAVEIEVVAQGALPRRRPRPGQPGFDPFDFFDPFAGQPFPRGLLDPSSDNFADDFPPPPKELELAEPLDPNAFLRVLTSPQRIVVGQQITVDVYGYGRKSISPQQVRNEPSRPDFFAFRVDDADDDPIRVPIGEDVWTARRLAQYLLFPVKAGKLTIGSFEGQFAENQLRSRRAIERRSAPIELVVEEPPLAGRPPGYRLGDVGRYELTATVEPRAISAGEAISVVARLEGVGNVPTKIAVPQQNGVEWLEPTVIADVEPKGSQVRGFRTFTYVVKFTEPGSFALGELALPYWDPEASAYRTTRAALGTIAVSPGTTKNDQPRTAPPPLATLGKPRRGLDSAAARGVPLGDRPIFWLFLFGAPLGVVLADAGLRLSRFLRQRQSARQSDPRELALQALGEARKSAQKDATGAVAQLERALFLAIEAGTGLRARALLKEELARELEQAGVSSATAAATLSLLADCESARFTGAEAAADAQLPRRAEPIVLELLRHKRRRS